VLKRYVCENGVQRSCPGTMADPLGRISIWELTDMALDASKYFEECYRSRMES
jgi:hypothetical protein